MEKLAIFARITKVDAVQRMVYGTVVEETLDKAKEIFDYESSKPYFQKWSGEIAKATDGKSHGNVRAMHGKIAAGKLTEINFDDPNKRIDAAAKIVDDAEWKKVEEGVYTGFSIGGAYVKRWKDEKQPDLTRYTADPVEVSIVDNPCGPNCFFTMVKADGTSEQREFKALDPTFTNEQVAAKATELAKAAGDQSKWAQFIDQARADLTKASPQTTSETAAPVNQPAQTDKSGDGPWEQVWVSKDLAGQQFASKAELRAALAQKAADDVAKAAAAPVVDRLAELGQELDRRDGGKRPIGKAIADFDAAICPALGISADDLKVIGDFIAANPSSKALDAVVSPLAKDKAGAVVVPEETKLAVQDFVKMARTELAKAKPKPRKINIARVVVVDLAKLTDPKAKADVVAKSLYDVGRLASLISELTWLQESMNYEALIEADGSAVPGQMKASIASLCAVLRQLVEEETAELIGDGGAIEVFEMAAGTLPHGHIDQLVKFAAGVAALAKANDLLQKVGARNSKADKARIQKMHDLAVELDADCAAGDGKMADGELGKVSVTLSAVTAERDALAKTLAGLEPTITEILSRVKKIEAQPMPGGPARTHVVSKERDGLGGGGDLPADQSQIDKMIDGMSEEDRTTLVFKLAQRNGRPLQIGSR